MSWLAKKFSKNTRVPNQFVRVVTYTFALITISISLMQFYTRFVSNNFSAPIAAVLNVVSPYRIVNLYGPFAVMTQQRMEIIFEGSDDGENWQEYSFKYKPGDVNRRPPWNIPHQPRLDWQMWFAALGNIDNNRWVLRVMQRILENSQPVLGLLEKNPFPDQPPHYLRALFYQYDFSTAAEKEATGAWWSRRLVGDYVPPVHL